jgi:hypothetical protein
MLIAAIGGYSNRAKAPLKIFSDADQSLPCGRLAFESRKQAEMRLLVDGS